MSSIYNVIWFLLVLFAIAGCCNCTNCIMELSLRTIDMYYERQLRLTRIVPRNIDIVNRIPPEKYTVIINPPGYPISVGLTEEYSNV